MADGFQLLISAITGGAAGAFITAIATDRRNRRELALRFSEKYIENFGKFATAKSYLTDFQKMADPKVRNETANLANWLEIMAASYLAGHVDCVIMDSMGLPIIAKRYFEAMRSAQQIDAQGKKLPAFIRDDLENEYPALTRLMRGVSPDCSC